MAKETETAEETAAKQEALELLKLGLESGDSAGYILDSISTVWDGDPMELINKLI